MAIVPRQNLIKKELKCLYGLLCVLVFIIDNLKILIINLLITNYFAVLINVLSENRIILVYVHNY